MNLKFAEFTKNKRRCWDFEEIFLMRTTLTEEPGWYEAAAGSLWDVYTGSPRYGE